MAISVMRAAEAPAEAGTRVMVAVVMSPVVPVVMIVRSMIRRRAVVDAAMYRR